MLNALRAELNGADVLAMAAAVADFRPERHGDQKIKKDSSSGLSLELTSGLDLLVETMEQRQSGSVFTLGFALETENGPANARRKLSEKGMDMVALNLANEPESGFDSVTNRVTIIPRDESMEELPLLDKSDVADVLLDRIELRLG